MSLLDRLLPRSRRFANQISWFDHESTTPVDQPMGAALLVRREVVETVGPLDERFRIHFNDVDWCYRIRKAAWEIYFVHGAEIVHHLGVTTIQENRQLALQGELMRNTFDYYRKHFGRGGLFWVRFWMVLGYGSRRMMCIIPDTIRPTPRSRLRTAFFRGALRAAWTGNPDQFSL